MTAIYCSTDDFKLVSGISVGSNCELTSAQATSFIEKAQSIIDSMLKGCYVIPFVTGSVPAKIRWLCADLSSSFAVRALYVNTDQNRNMFGEQLYRDAMNELSMIATNDIKLLDATGDVVDYYGVGRVGRIDNTRKPNVDRAQSSTPTYADDNGLETQNEHKFSIDDIRDSNLGTSVELRRTKRYS